MTITVSDCSDCPFMKSESVQYYTREYCNLTSKNNVCMSVSITEPPPPWCPLRTDKIVVEMKDERS